MVDIRKVDKPEALPYHVEEAPPDRQRREGRGQTEEGEERDEFERETQGLKKIVGDSAATDGPSGRWWAHSRASLRMTPRGHVREVSEEPSDTQEISTTFVRRMLFLWGLINAEGRPRARVIAMYGAVAALIAVSVITILRILWR